MRPFSALACLVLLSGVAPAHAGCADAPLKLNAGSLSITDVRSFETRFRTGLGKACDWWGPAFAGTYFVDIEDSRGPSMALVPAWRGDRGQMLFRAGPVRAKRAAITHEIVHVLAPNANRFLAEGLAVWAHTNLGGEAAYPNFGGRLHTLARSAASRADMAALERIATPGRLQLADLDDRDAYIVAGSFVGFLIETRGLDSFRTLYARTPLVAKRRNPGDRGRWQAVYGSDFGRLVDAWRLGIGAP